jgi:hypothetical protein
MGHTENSRRIRTLNRVIATCYRGLGAYQSAFHRVGDAHIRDGMRQLMKRHRTTIDVLRDTVVDLGGTAATGSTFSSVDRGKQSLRGAVSTPAVVARLKAVDELVWETLSEEEVNEALPDEADELNQVLEAREVHQRWFDRLLSPRPPAVDERY